MISIIIPSDQMKMRQTQFCAETNLFETKQKVEINEMISKC